MAQLADEPTTLMFHAEMIPPITASVGDDVQTSMPPLSPSGPLTQYQTFLDSRPAAFETYAIEEILSMAHLAPNLPLHIVHLSAVQAITRLRDARSKGIKVTAETCFHYLSLAAEEIKEGDTRHKCCPPIRTKSNQDGLWDEMLHSPDSVIKTVVSDHSPCTPNLKMLPPHIAGAGPKGRVQQTGHGDFFSAWGGVSSVGLGLPILWTDREARGFGILDVVKWCCHNPAKQVGLEHRKGAIAVGMDADITVFDDEASFEVCLKFTCLFYLSYDFSKLTYVQVQTDTMLFRNKCSPYQGKTLKGVVRQTWLAGRPVFSREDGFDQKVGPTGRLLLEPRTSKIIH